MEMIDLTDGVVVLRPPAPADADRVAELCQDPTIQEKTTIPSPYTRADAAWFVREVVVAGWDTDKACTWGVRDAATDALEGVVGLTLEPQGSAEIGYWLGPAARGRGLMTRAVRLALDHAFAEDGLALDRVLWTAYVGNEPSRRVAERAGFRVEGAVRRHLVQRGVRRDAWLGTLLRDDPRPAPRRMAP